MVSKMLLRSVSYDGFDIQTAACLRNAMWYPEYEISLAGLVVSPWRAPDIDGRRNEEDACDWGVHLAMADIDIGLKRLFRSPPR